MLKRTPLFAVHQKLGARLIEFGGWEMPLHYSGILDEHHAVRTAAGLFDISHMGEIVVRGGGAAGIPQPRPDQRHPQTPGPPGPIHSHVQRARRRD